MSPFSKLLGDLRRSRSLRQNKLAELMGYEQSYLSALELGIKGVPSADFVKKMNDALHLTASEQEEVIHALARSSRKFNLPINSPQPLYELCYELNQSLAWMQPRQIEIIVNVVRLLNESNCVSSQDTKLHQLNINKKLEGHKM